MEIGTNKIMVWKTNLDYLEIGELNDSEIKQNLFIGISSVDNFNRNLLNLIKSYEINGFIPKFYNIFDIIENEDITAYVISQIIYRRCSVYLVIQTSNIGFRYLCYFYDKIYHNAECFGTSYNLLEKKDIINYFEKTLNKIKNTIDLNIFPKLKEPLFNRNYDIHFGIS
jgi:hypothetical protein